MSLSEELSWRGFINQTTYSDIKELDKHKPTFYHGYDASDNSLTVGNLAAVMMDRCLIRHGCNAVIVAGGATSLIGDPGGKNSERPLLLEEDVRKNVSSVQEQLKFLLGSHVTYTNNLDWLGQLNLLEFLRDIGKHFSMTPLVQRDYIATRIGEGGAGISYTEFSYTLLQGYDYLHLFDKYNVRLQLAGSDQWGNSLSGVELVKKLRGENVNILTCPLIINKSTGIKFGKSEKGAIWLNADKTSPVEFYQFWINMDDDGLEEYFKIFTEISRDELEQLMVAHLESPSSRVGQRRLAAEITNIVHGVDVTKICEKVTDVLTGKTSIRELSDVEFKLISKEIPTISLSKDKELIELVCESGLASSKTEARRLVEGGAIYVDGKVHQGGILDLSKLGYNRVIIRRGKAFKDSAIVEFKK